MHAKTNTNQNTTSFLFLFFFFKRFSHRKVEAEWTEVSDAVNVGRRVLFEMLLLRQSVAQQLPPPQQQGPGGDDSCLQPASEGKGWIKQSHVDDVLNSCLTGLIHVAWPHVGIYNILGTNVKKKLALRDEGPFLDD